MEYDFTQYRTVLGFQKSKRYLKWMKIQFPDLDLHHILGSVHSKKFTDYLVVPIHHTHHLNVVESHKAIWFSKYLEVALGHLLRYACNEIGMSLFETRKLLPNYEPESVKAFIEAVYQRENE
jgi:hypothetical protein